MDLQASYHSAKTISQDAVDECTLLCFHLGVYYTSGRINLNIQVLKKIFKSMHTYYKCAVYKLLFRS